MLTPSRVPGTTFVEVDFELSALDDDQRARLAVENLHKSPFLWPARRKAIVMAFPMLAATFAAYSAGAYGMAAADARNLWNLSTTSFNLGITVFVLGFGFAPVLLALISELYGRYWVFVGSGLVFLLGTIGCAVTDSFGGMLVARLVTGSGASVFATLTGGAVSDLYPKEDRNMPMTIYSMLVMMGTGIGPLVSGAVADTLPWRWIFYLQIILIGATTLGVALVFRETRSNVLLLRNCQTLNKRVKTLEAEGHELRPRSRKATAAGLDETNEEQSSMPEFRVRGSQENLPVYAMLWSSFKFPLVLLATESIVFWFSLWVSFAWAILYMQFTSISHVFRTVYSFNSAQVGAVYSALVVGSIVGTVLSIAQDSIWRKKWPEMAHSPEGRLYLSCCGSFFLPAGLFMFGWTARPELHWILPTFAIGVVTVGIFIIYLAVFNYLADAYGAYASSALAAQSMCRNLFAGAFPLFTDKMFDNLGFGQAGSLLGGIGLGLCLVPWALVLFGNTIRRRSAFVQEGHL